MTLTEFLLARIAEDEADAQLAIGDDGGHWQQDAASIYEGHETRPVVDWVYGERWSHIARHDPARVLAECEAKRRIIELAGEQWGELDPYTTGETPPEWVSVLRLLALPYADHEDFLPDWKP